MYEAIRPLEAEGVEELSMRKLGTRLGTAATSLHRHVANKDELIELVVDDVYGEPDVPTVVDGTRWRAAVTHAATELRAMTLRHPWIAPELGQVGLVHLGPNAMRMSSALLAQLTIAEPAEWEDLFTRDVNEHEGQFVRPADTGGAVVVVLRACTGARGHQPHQPHHL
ncbi:TetR/AcrR family transcriptional regulator [Streptomyces natalensis]|uniref:TetR/AcrR family transcriptional regulator n=1 Tax=Streptomyces natalensis TaxID=68242 RepID=UPI003B836810